MRWTSGQPLRTYRLLKHDVSLYLGTLDNNVDAKKILISDCIPTRRFEETARSPSDHMDEDSILNDLQFHDLTLTEAVNMAQIVRSEGC